MFFNLFIKFVQQVGLETIHESRDYEITTWELNILGFRFYVEDNEYGMWARLTLGGHVLYDTLALSI